MSAEPTTHSQLDWEVAIEWSCTAAFEYDNVRENVATTRTLVDPPPRWNGDMMVVWALLHRKTPTRAPPSNV